MSYLQLVRTHPRLVGFGFALTLFSSFGQTFFIAVFGAEIRSEFDLTHGSFGALYSTATLISGFSIIWLGGLIDRFALRSYTRVVAAGLIAGAVLFATARSLAGLFVAILFLRLFGQGLMGHTGMTTIARFFRGSRGKALSAAALGFPVGEALLPRAFVAIKELIGWRTSWVVVALGVSLLLMPLLEMLFRSMVAHGTEDDGAAGSETAKPAADAEGWRRRAVVRDARLYLVLPAVLAPPFLATGLFFHQVALAGSKGWSMDVFTTAFVAFATAQVASSITIGPLVDRLGASRILFLYLVPMGAALTFLASGNHPLIVVAFMFFAGLSAGAQGTVVGAYWVEAYGVLHLGAIRSMVMALMVLSTAAAPVLFGRMIDAGTSFEAIAWMGLSYCVVASVLAGAGRRESPRAA
jgi:MFS family permease